jgi:hypothetical protein
MAELRDVSERFGDQRQPDLCSFFSARRLPISNKDPRQFCLGFSSDFSRVNPSEVRTKSEEAPSKIKI